MLIEMGFDNDGAHAALRASSNDLARAVDSLSRSRADSGGGGGDGGGSGCDAGSGIGDGGNGGGSAEESAAPAAPARLVMSEDERRSRVRSSRGATLIGEGVC